jgi:hypothetical protein
VWSRTCPVPCKGLETGGKLRPTVPRWLNEEPNRARVVAFTPAQPRDGAQGRVRQAAGFRTVAAHARLWGTGFQPIIARKLLE